MGLRIILPHWVDRDAHRCVLMEGTFVVGEVRSTVAGWSAIWCGEPVAKGLRSKVTAQIAVARARARALGKLIGDGQH